MSYPENSIGYLRKENKSTDGQFTIHIVSAHGIAAKDITGTSDPFVIVRFINHDGSIDEIETFQTPVIPESLNPVWDYKKGWQKINPNWKIIQFEIRDKDFFRTQFVGLYEHVIESIVHQTSPTPSQYNLKPRNDPKKNDVVTGTIKLSFEYTNAQLHAEDVRRRFEEAQKKKDEQKKQEELEVQRKKEAEIRKQRDIELHRDSKVIAELTDAPDLTTNRKPVEKSDNLSLYIPTLTPENFKNPTDSILKQVMKLFDDNIFLELQKHNFIASFMGWMLIAWEFINSEQLIKFMNSVVSKCDLDSLLNNERFSDNKDVVLTVFIQYLTTPLCESLHKSDKLIKVLDWTPEGRRPALLRVLRLKIKGLRLGEYRSNPIFEVVARYYMKEFSSDVDAALRIYLKSLGDLSVAVSPGRVTASKILTSDLRLLLWDLSLRICLDSKNDVTTQMQDAFNTLASAAEIFCAKGDYAIDSDELEQYRKGSSLEAISRFSESAGITGVTSTKIDQIRQMCEPPSFPYYRDDRELYY